MRSDGAREGFRQAMAWLHTWTGLILGWLLFAIFLTGTLAFFKHELNLWSRPELHALGPAAPLDAAGLARAEAALHALAPAAQSWRLTAADERRPVAALNWREPADPAQPGQRAKFEQRWLDPAGGAPVEARTTFGAGEFFYRFHFELRSAQQSRWILEGRWLIGLATLLMFVALLSGIVTHRRFFKDFFTFRPRAKAAQRAWLDAHNISGVLALPFYLLITFSGLLTLHSLYMPAGIAAAYGKDSGAYFNELSGDPLPRNRGLSPKTGEGQALPVLGEAAWAALLAQARREWPSGRIEAVSLLREGGQPLVEFSRHEGDRLQYRSPRQIFDAETGRRLHLADTAAPASRTYGVLYGLHIARFAGVPLRWLLFGFGLLGSTMIATGLVLWCVKRKAEAQRRQQGVGVGHRLVDALNIAAIAGLPLAMAGFFYGNRLLSLDLPQRGDMELRVFFAVWGLGLIAAVLGFGWRRMFAAGALAFAGLPLLNALTGPVHLGQTDGLFAVQAVDMGFLAGAALLALLAWKCRPGARLAGSGRSPQPTLAGTEGA
jgi:uncharacterized iron-regulated membrane protein